jgi:fructan beta-fructosidase
MRRWYLPVVLLLVAAPASFQMTSVAPKSSDYDQPHRPQFHFSPVTNWMNDPNGLVYHSGEFHLFYQFNPFGDRWGHMSWGHAVSPDLVHWKHLPVALLEEDGIMIFSGSAVVDSANSSGLGTTEKPPLIAIYTGHTENLQTQNLAFSTDRGRTWQKYRGNPVLDIGKKDFRDPKVFRHIPTGRWIMAVALPVERKVAFYGSFDLINWERLGEFGPAGEVSGIWECPDLFELPIAKSPGEKRWVLIVNLNPGAVAGGSGTQYFTGDFDGATFRADPAPAPQWADYGRDFYAAVSWSDVPNSDGRRLWIGWMSNWEYADKIPTSPWRGAMSVPRSLSLEKRPGGLALIQTPVRELSRLRTEVLTTGNIGLPEANRMLRERKVEGDLLEIEAEFRGGTARDFGLSVRAGQDQRTKAGYDVRRAEVYIDRRSSGNVSFHPAFPGRHAAPLLADGGKIRLHLLVDRSSVELFANGGERVLTELIFPDPESHAVHFYESGGKATLLSLRIWKLASIW